MKKIATLLLVVLTTLTIFSCDRGSVDGKWEDNIKLSAKDIVFDKYQHSVTISTQSTSWWITDIIYKGIAADLNGIEKTAKNFVLTKQDFKIERKDDGKTIIITMEENNLNADRVLKLGMQSGDYFDGITVTQTK